MPVAFPTAKRVATLVFLLLTQYRNVNTRRQYSLECGDMEVKCGTQCVAKAFTEPFEEAVQKFEDYIQEIGGEGTEIADIGISGVDGGQRHEFWVLKFLWLKARWGGVCEKAAFAIATEVGISLASKGTEGDLKAILEATALVDANLAKIAAGNLPMSIEEESSEDKTQNADEALKELGQSTELEEKQVSDAENKLDQNAAEWETKHEGSEANPYVQLKSFVGITNNYMELSFSSSGYGIDGVRPYHAKTGPQQKDFGNVPVPEFRQDLTFIEWLRYHKRLRCKTLPYGIDAENLKAETYDVEDHPVKQVLEDVNDIAPQQDRGVTIRHDGSLKRLKHFLRSKNFPSVYSVAMNKLSWWNDNKKINKLKYFQLIREAELKWPKSAPVC